MPEKPPTIVELIWDHELVFSGRSGDVQMTLDSGSIEGPSPMQALAFGFAACMAMDVVHIILRGRHDLRGLKADLVGQRAHDDPHRFTKIELKYTVNGRVPPEVVERAIQLSRDKYCSVWHSMRQDIELAISHVVASGG